MTQLIQLNDESSVEVDKKFLDHFNILRQCMEDDTQEEEIDTDDNSILLDIDKSTFTCIQQIINSIDRNEDIDLSEINPIVIGLIYEKMVYYLDAKPNTCKYLWKSLNQDIKYISKFNEVMNNDQLFTAIVYIIKYRSENGLNCDNFITEINTLFPDIWNDMTKEIRICIMLDTTSSMGHTIIAQKNQAHELYQKLQTAFGAVVSIKSIAIGYRDYTDPRNVFISNECSTSEELRTELDKMNPVGGSDEPEAPELGLNALRESNFYKDDPSNINILVIAADAIPHDFLGQNDSSDTHIRMCKEFTEVHGDWASILLDLIKTYNVITYGVDVSNRSTKVDIWMSVICTLVGTEVTKTISETTQFMIKDIVSWSFERKLKKSKIDTMSNASINQLIENMNKTKITSLPPEVQASIDEVRTTYRSLSAVGSGGAGSSCKSESLLMRQFSHQLERACTDHSELKASINKPFCYDTDDDFGASSAPIYRSLSVDFKRTKTGDVVFPVGASVPMTTLKRYPTCSMGRADHIEAASQADKDYLMDEL